MNYVRKLGFEEAPDYDFLRELFTRVLRTLGEPEDGIFDWMLLNGGKGWEASNVCILSFSCHFPSLTACAGLDNCLGPGACERTTDATP
jgi:casein kinase 1